MTRCSRCQDELIAGSRYCVACGHNNFNPDDALAEGHLRAFEEEQKAKSDREETSIFDQIMKIFDVWRIW